jgi:hypothetical protein
MKSTLNDPKAGCLRHFPSPTVGFFAYRRHFMGGAASLAQSIRCKVQGGLEVGEVSPETGSKRENFYAFLRLITAFSPFYAFLRGGGGKSTTQSEHR